MKYIALIVILLSSCSQPTVVEKLHIRDSVIVVDVPKVERVLPASINTDSLIAAWEKRGNDTTTIIKYFPREKVFQVQVKPEPVLVPVHDTLRVVTEIPANNGSDIWLVLALVVVCMYVLYNLIVKQPGKWWGK